MYVMYMYIHVPVMYIHTLCDTCLCLQMYLQRLNYLSVSYKITGKYDDVTLQAVKTFQV